MPTQGTRNVTVAGELTLCSTRHSTNQNYRTQHVYVSCTISCCKHEHVILFQKNDASCRLTQLMMGRLEALICLSMGGVDLLLPVCGCGYGAVCL